MNIDLRRLVFRFRGYTPVPFMIFALLGSHPQLVPALVGCVCVLFGEGLRIWGISYAGPATRSRRIQAQRLITDGPYAYLRHPLYAGNFFLSLGCCLIAWAWMPWLVFFLLAAFGLQYGLIISLEEEELQHRFGERYTIYSLHVPQLFPHRSPYHGAEAVVPSFKGTLKSERATFVTIVTFVVFLTVRHLVKTSGQFP